MTTVIHYATGKWALQVPIDFQSPPAVGDIIDYDGASLLVEKRCFAKAMLPDFNTPMGIVLFLTVSDTKQYKLPNDVDQ